jgi:hypothetical protein
LIYTLRADQVNWSTFSNWATSSLSAVLQLEEFGDGSVLFRNRHGWRPFRALCRRAEQKRDLWFGHGRRKINLAGRDGDKFIYSHHDGPFTRTIVYVVAHRGKYRLGISAPVS